MKSFLFAAALLTSTAAIAQTDPKAPDPVLVAPTSQVVPPSNAAPEQDARGIAVISDAALAPPGFNQAPGTMTGMGGPADATQPPAPQPSDPSYPACSRTVTDNCVQTYERRSRR